MRSFYFHHLICILNITTFLILLLTPPDKGEPHDCEAITSHFVTQHPDLQETPLTNPDLIFLVDRSYCKNEKGNYQTARAVTTQHDLLERRSLTGARSAQQAELHALTRPC